jgi:Txe/YoeB family toxin of toxin-antitoxin system
LAKQVESPAPRGPRVAVFQPEFREDLRYWVEVDRKTALRVLTLVEAILRDPFAGIGKPEPLQISWPRRMVAAADARASRRLPGQR